MNKEDYFLEKFIKPCTEICELFPLEVGDDCAVISSSKDVLVSTDSSIENRHFPKDLNPYFIAYRSVAIAASDVIAMGSYPAGYLLSISHPDPTDAWFKDFAHGIRDFNNLHKTKLVGGDLTKGSLNICVTVFGEVQKKILKRNAAEVNDDIYISNILGLGREGYKSFLDGDTSIPNQYIQPKLMTKKDVLHLNPLTNSAIDISDGFLLDLDRLCAASQKGAEISITNEILKTDLEDVVAGDDYILLFTANKSNREEIVKILPKSKIVGEIIEGTGLKIKNSLGKELNFDEFGWDSFKS